MWRWVGVCSADLICAGTGVRHLGVAVSLDIGEDLTRATYTVTLHPGGKLFVGANDCASYGVPSAASVSPQLVLVSAPTSHPFGVVYRASAPGGTGIAHCV